MIELAWNVSGSPETALLLVILSAGLSLKQGQRSAPLADKLSTHVIHSLLSCRSWTRRMEWKQVTRMTESSKLKYGASQGRVISLKLSCHAISPLTAGDGKALEKNAKTKRNEYIRKIACRSGVSALFGGRRNFPFNARKGKDL